MRNLDPCLPWCYTPFSLFDNRGDGMNFDPFDILRVGLLPQVGPTRGRALLQRFHTWHALRNADRSALRALPGMSTPWADQLFQHVRNRDALNAIEGIVDRTRELMDRDPMVHYLPFPDPRYPPLLDGIYDPPLFLFVRGVLSALTMPCVGVVGTRHPSDYGRDCAVHVARELARQGLVITSGLALGIDTIAHHTALKHHTPTIAVLGSSLDIIYPSSNLRLADSIMEQGCLVSEFPFTTPPDLVNFPRRNRIISGLSRAIVLVESAQKGGGMITAHCAFDQNREVFVVPGSIFSPLSKGPHLLLRRGMAHPFQTVADLFAELPQLRLATEPDRPRSMPQISLEESAVLRSLGSGALHVDELSTRTSIPVSSLHVLLLSMEFSGLVRPLPGRWYEAVG